MEDLPPNHHAHYRQFCGAFGYVAALTMVAGRGADAKLVADLAAVDTSDRVLDIGCGPGTAARTAARRGATVTGVDPSGPMLRLGRAITVLRRPKGSLDWVEAGAEKMPLPDDSFSVCWSLASVHHWPDLDGGLDEVDRVLEPGGLFIALERRSEPGATGNASHGWTPQQAETFASMLTERGYTDAVATNHDLGKRKVVVVTARR